MMQTIDATGIRLSQTGDVVLTLEDGSVRQIDAARLWSECPSAAGRVRRMAERHISPPRDLRVVTLTPIGNYGVNIAFSDGHDRGIYPWDMLARLSQTLSVSDFIIP